MSQNINVSYPIYLYLPKKQVFLFLVLGCLFIWLGRLDSLVTDELIVRVYASLTVLIGVFFIIIGIINLCNTAPNLIIRRTGFNHFALFKKGRRSHYYWKDIQDISLDSQVLKHHRTWYVSLTMKQGGSVDVGLRPMRYSSLMLNEKEIYHLIKQSFEGKRPSTVSAISMNLNDRFRL